LNVTDAGIDTLLRMTGLEELLHRTKVSNAGLAKLARLKNLRALDLRYSRATASGARELMAAVPACKVMLQDSSIRETKRTSEAAAVAEKGEDAIAGWLRSIGAKVQLEGGHLTGVSLKSTSITDREIAILAKLPHLTELGSRYRGRWCRALAHIASRQTSTSSYQT
jgi:hypothetical protein